MKRYFLAMILAASPVFANANDIFMKFALYDRAKVRMANIWVKLPNAPQKFEANKLYRGTWNGEVIEGYNPNHNTYGSYLRATNKSNNDLVIVFASYKESYKHLKMFLGVNIVEDQIVLYSDNLETINSSGKWRYESDTGALDAGTYEVIIDK